MSLGEREGTGSRSRSIFVSLASSLIIPLKSSCYCYDKRCVGLILLGFVEEVGGLVEGLKGKKLLTLVEWALFAVVCARIAKIMLIQTVQFTETAYASVALFKTSYMWYVLQL